MNPITRSATILAVASEGNPIISTVVVVFFTLGINALFGTIETLMTGNRFDHVGDIVLLVSAIAYAAYAVYQCAIYNSGLSGIEAKKVTE
jgi:hypothetical protein